MSESKPAARPTSSIHFMKGSSCGRSNSSPHRGARSPQRCNAIPAGDAAQLSPGEAQPPSGGFLGVRGGSARFASGSPSGAAPRRGIGSAPEINPCNISWASRRRSRSRLAKRVTASARSPTKFSMRATAPWFSPKDDLSSALSRVEALRIDRIRRRARTRSMSGRRFMRPPGSADAISRCRRARSGTASNRAYGGCIPSRSKPKLGLLDQGEGALSSATRPPIPARYQRRALPRQRRRHA